MSESKSGMQKLVESIEDIYHFLDGDSETKNCTSYSDDASVKIILEKLSKLDRVTFFQIIFSGAACTLDQIFEKLKSIDDNVKH